ncbi:uncharacterized protein LOC124545785 [Schistocerca americana]|uniref:uncharacterized protein LOC124545785 n=1 Tax=Schistocerca americana TaxID=7009 RepID=UPI001F4FAF56|nr:uncharacterized protein LOC124545785 [Schistocerca americana]
MQKTLFTVLVVAACVGITTAQVSCSTECLNLATQIRNADSIFTAASLYSEFFIDGCNIQCLNQRTQSTTTTTRTTTNTATPSTTTSRIMSTATAQERRIKSG